MVRFIVFDSNVDVDGVSCGEVIGMRFGLIFVFVVSSVLLLLVATEAESLVVSENDWRGMVGGACALYFFDASRILHFSTVFIFSISFACWNFGQLVEDEECSPEQFAHIVLTQFSSLCGGKLQLTQAGRFLQCFKVWPSFWQDLHRIGLGK